MERKTNLVRSKVFYVLTILLVITISNSQAGLLKVWKGIDATVRRSYPDEDTRLILQNAELQGVVPTK